MRSWTVRLASIGVFCALAGTVSAQYVGTFVAESTYVSRAEAIKRIVELDPSTGQRVEELRAQMPPLPVFSDMDLRAWYAPYAEVAFEKGIVIPFEDGSLRPSDPLTYRDAILLRSRAFDMQALPQAPTASGNDLAVAEAALTQRGIVLPQGYQTDTPLPQVAFTQLAEAHVSVANASSLSGLPLVDALASPLPGMFYEVSSWAMPSSSSALSSSSSSSSSFAVIPSSVVVPFAASSATPSASPIFVSIPSLGDSPSSGPAASSRSSSSTAFLPASTNAGTIAVQVPSQADAPAANPFAVASTSITGPAQSGQAVSLNDHQREQLQYASTLPFSITMPSLGIKDLTITHPSDPATSKGILAPLKVGVGHLFSYPGSQSTVMIYGHSSGYPWDVSQFTQIFRQINKLKVGDTLYVTYQGNLYVYTVTQKETIAARNTTALQSNGDGEQLILYTCWPPDDISQRYIVRAAPVEVIPIQ